MTNGEWAQALPEGWHQLYLELIDALERIDPDLKVVQAKEKFGALRVYLAAPTPELHALIDAASRASSLTCQTCGREGQITKSGTGLIAALCDEHAAGAARADAPVSSFRLDRDGRVWSVRRYPRKAPD